MPRMKDVFAHFYPPEEKDIAAGLQTGLVVPDTNVLLDLYRMQVEARAQLFGTLEKLGTRLWIPYQVGLEFHRNRLNVIAEREKSFAKAQSEFEAAIDGLCAKVRDFHRTRLAATGSVARIEQALRGAQKLIAESVSDAEDCNDVRLDGHTGDQVLARLEALLDDRVGAPMEPKELEDAKKEAKRRVEAKEPPGYKDSAKPDPTGDYLVFKQTMNEAAHRKLPVVFITNDRKDDWYRREQGLTLGSRYELRQEMTAGAGVPFLAMTTDTFLRHAKTYLSADVSEETMDQARELSRVVSPDHRVALMMRRLSDPLGWEDAFDLLLETISLGKAPSRAELAFTLRTLMTTDLSVAEISHGVTEAALRGLGAGLLTEADAAAVLSAVELAFPRKTNDET